jgi:hypothetical protein
LAVENGYSAIDVVYTMGGGADVIDVETYTIVGDIDNKSIVDFLYINQDVVSF